MARDVLLRPLITEKTSRLMEEGQYAFVADLKANKVQIRQAIEEQYPGVRIKSLRTMIQRGKRRSQNTRAGLVTGRTSFYKKVIVSLKDESAEIDFFEQI